MRNVTLAATQMACSWDQDENIANAEGLVTCAIEDGAQIILLQELFETPYFCQDQNPEFLTLAKPVDQSRVVQHFRSVAQRHGVVLPISFYEEAGTARFNSLAVIDTDGEILTVYRKTHLPQAPGYEEKFYFSHGDSGFDVAETKFGRLGCGVCWDQWFPETARCLVLKGAEILMFPTAIGSEPENPELDSCKHWQRTMQGHAAANMIPLVASNRVGSEQQGNRKANFYGSSFIAGYTGEILAQANKSDETYLVQTIDLDEATEYRTTWGVFRDRRPYMYGAINTLDGSTAY